MLAATKSVGREAGCQRDEQDAGDHEGPPRLTSAALAPTDVDRGVDKTNLLQYNYLKFEIIKLDMR